MKVCEIEKLKCVIRYPKNFSGQNKYPVILFLHGAGSRSDENKLINNPYFTQTEKYEDFPFISIAPLCSENTWFDLFEHLKALVVKIDSASFVDSERIYLMGASMGGYATWQLAMSMPEYFAAIVPVCGGGMYWNAARLANVPVWAFHGGKDTTVLPEESQKMVDRVNRCGGSAKLTVYPENGHDAWNDTYSNPKVFQWLLQHKNTNAKEISDKYNNEKIYG